MDLNSNVLVWCTASGGYPHPDLSAALVDGDSEMAVTGLKEMVKNMGNLFFYYFMIIFSG